MSDQVNHPTHYTKHPSGIECIDITGSMGFNLGNAVKYIWRAGSKIDEQEDLAKALRYIDFEINGAGDEQMRASEVLCTYDLSWKYEVILGLVLADTALSEESRDMYLKRAERIIREHVNER